MTHRIAIIGASGYTGAELVRLISGHPEMQITALTADRKAGQAVGAVWPHLAHLGLPDLVTIEDVDFGAVDLAFLALPHGVSHRLVPTLPETVKVVDLSADFRLTDPAAYERWYGAPHGALDWQAQAVFGLPEVYREKIRAARLVANTGCYVATSLLPLIPLLQGGVIAPDPIVIDAKSGVSGAGRSLRETLLFTEVNDGFSAYGVAHHRHMGELDQELSKAAGTDVVPTFTPHLVPMSRGMMATIYVRGEAGAVHDTLTGRYADEPFVHVLPAGQYPGTASTRGANLCRIGVVPDRASGRTIVISVLDNLMKGASGQALQNANLMLGCDETSGLTGTPLVP